MYYVGNAFSPNMIEGDCTLKITQIDKFHFVEACAKYKSIIGHPEIADLFGVKYNRESITLEKGDVLYTVTPHIRPLANRVVKDGTKYVFIPEEDGYTYRRIEVL